MSLDAKSIIECQDTSKLVEVQVPEWGGSVWVRIMSGVERDAWEIDTHKDKNLRARLAFYTLCDSTGARLFTSPADLAALSKKSARALDRIFDAASDLNGISPSEKGKLEKNSE